ncbi:hypothetical protein ACED98_04940 [Streptococcus thoraltensis]
MTIKSRLGDAVADRTVFIKSSQQGLLLIVEEYQVLPVSFLFLVLKVNSFDDTKNIKSRGKIGKRRPGFAHEEGYLFSSAFSWSSIWLNSHLFNNFF